MPSLYLLRLLLSEPRPEEPLQTEIILQDYNDLVLQLVTFPNVLLTWCMYTIYSPIPLFRITLTRLRLFPLSRII